MPKKKKETFDLEHMKPEDALKFEIAKELGLDEKVLLEGWRSLTAKESGRIGGLMTKRKREMNRMNQKKAQELQQQNGADTEGKR